MSRRRITRVREVRACSQCRQSKLGCDKVKPQCGRCIRAGIECSFISDHVQGFSDADADGDGSTHGALDVAKSIPEEPASPQGASVTSSLSDSPGEPRGLEGAPFLSVHDQSNEYASKSTPGIGEQPDEGHSAGKSRNRLPLSCFRCRQIKVKCDRKLPCSRCVRNRKGNECSYEHRSTVMGDATQKVYRGEAHWVSTLEDIEALMSPNIGLHCVKNGPDALDGTFSANFPFGESVTARNLSRKALLARIPEKPLAEAFVRLYLEIIEKTHSLLDVAVFKAEIQAFWTSPSSVDDSWLAQFFMVLALGCQAYNGTVSQETNATGQLHDPDQLLEGAQVFLGRTIYMARPNFANIRTLCMMVIAKQIHRMACHESDSCWPLTGVIVRLGMVVGLSCPLQTAFYLGGLNGETVQAQETLRTTITYLELRQSLTTGMPLLLRPSDLEYFNRRPGQTPEPDLPPPTGLGDPAYSFLSNIPQRMQELTFHGILTSTFSVVSKIIDRGNTTREAALGPYISMLNARSNELHGLLGLANMLPIASQAAAGNDGHNNITASTSSEDHDLERIVLNIFLRRAHLSLHQRGPRPNPDPTESHSFIHHPPCYWACLESSLALLALQRSLFEDHLSTDNNETRTRGRRLAWFAGLYRQDFFAAAMTLCLHLLRDGPPPELVAPPECSRRGAGEEAHGAAGPAVDPTTTILETLRSCKDIWQRERHMSTCQDKSFGILDELIGALEAGALRPRVHVICM